MDRGKYEIASSRNKHGESRKTDYRKLYDAKNDDSNLDLDESSGKSSGSRVFSRSRYKNDVNEITTKTKQIDLDDFRISKLLRKLKSETDENTVVDLCNKLKTAVMDHSNENYIYKSFDILAEDLIYVLDHCPKTTTQLITDIFGMMGYVIRRDFPIYKSKICKTYKGLKYLRVPIMNALEKTLRMDSNRLDLMDQMSRLMELLRDFLEASDVAEIFIAITNVISVIAENYAKHFQTHFSTIVDIVVGWHLETEQKPAVKQHCSILLQRFKTFFERDMQFTLDLLGQLLEDIDGYSEKLDSSSSAKDLGSHLCVCNTILKCLYSSPEVLWFTINNKLSDESFLKILQIVNKALNFCMDEEIILSANEFILILLECRKNQLEELRNDIQNIIVQEFENLDKFSNHQLASFFTLLVKFISEFKSNLPASFLDKVMDLDGFLVTHVRYNQDRTVQKGLIKTYQEILNIKNVPLLQEAYRKILEDIGDCLIIPPLNRIEWDSSSKRQKICDKQALFSLNFNLIAISKLATTQNSIIAMWSLQPSILELLAFKLRIYDGEIWEPHQMLRISILKLLVAHCMKNNNFISSSSLFITKKTTSALWGDESSSANSSPASQHFKMILDFIATSFQTNMIEDMLEIILDWCNNLIQQTTQYDELLKNNVTFTQIIKSINIVSVKCVNSLLILKCASCMDSLLSFESLNHEVMTSIAEVSCVQMCSVSSEIRNRYTFIFSLLPLSYCLEQVNYPTGINSEISEKISELEHWHLSKTQGGGELKSQFFKDFIESIMFSNQYHNSEEVLLNAFNNCWILEEGTAREYEKYATKDIRPLVSFIQWEAAKFCVNNKLRTPLGKPHDTFVKIEMIIREYAKVTALKEGVIFDDYKAAVENMKNARKLLGFMECLEKAIYNASDGNAYGIPPPDKPARIFFRLNTATCKDWFSRNRTAVDLIALHNMELDLVIRYSQSVLKELIACGKTNEKIFDHVLLSLVWALLRNFESEALIGVYNWTRKVTGKKYVWIKMAADQAAGRKEFAADGYLKLLSEDGNFDNQITDFLEDQMLTCLFYSHQYTRLYDWYSEVEKFGKKPRVTVPIVNLTKKEIRLCMEFDEMNDYTTLRDLLSDWETLEEEPNVKCSLSMHPLFLNTGASIFASILDRVMVPDTVLTVVQTALQDCVRTKSKEYLNIIVFFNYLCGRIFKGGLTANNMKTVYINKKYGTYAMLYVLFYSELFDRESPEGQQQSVDVRLDVISMARKETNYLMCQRELLRCYQKITQFSGMDVPRRNENLQNLDTFKNYLTSPHAINNVNLWSENMTRCMYEHSKYLFFTNRKEEAILFAANATLGINNCLDTRDDLATLKLKERCTKFQLKLSEWLQQENDEILGNNVFNSIQNILADDAPAMQPSMMSDTEYFIGKLVQNGIKKCPDLAKAWSVFGNWCYRWGKKMVESKTDSDRPIDLQSIKQLIPEAKEEDALKIVNILNQQQITAEDEDIGPNEISSTEQIEYQLKTIPGLMDINSIKVQEIIELWKHAHRTIYKYYDLSADAYFKFLQLSCSTESETEDSSVVTATLRLLRLIVKHALGLQDVLEEGLARTPSEPWKNIIPQLFSRLNHHEPYVRRRVSELLCRVATDAPHLIIFPAVVSAAQSKNMNLSISENVEELLDGNGKDLNLNSNFNSLLDTLSEQSPETVKQVQLFVKELRRISILWDEEWLLSLQQIYSEYAKRFQNFEIEFQKVTDKTPEKISIFEEKYRVLMSPVIYVMTRLMEYTSKPPETNYEENFQDKFGGLISSVVDDLKLPFNSNDPLNAWQKFKQFYALMQNRVHKKTNNSLKMEDISPFLARMKNTVISMPGIEPGTQNGAVYIKSVDNFVQILLTKTKPKKLIFYGSDGKRYTYLFKGHEDLHLDERIMQFLSIANLMMKKSIDSDGRSTYYRAYHYSVIPLGATSGLISWVDGVTPIFSLYKKWQQREAANPKKDAPTVVMRPSEIFYNKITPLLREHKLKPTDNRKDWPLSVQRKVFEELQTETPRDLLSKEFWCHSTTASKWREIVRNYSNSLAVMSVIGYVIGLGDRHLDNILVKLASGEVVHIDYNVCFEKGKTLRVPEKVPFRITQNLEEALGVTGIEGIFRLACEHVLKSLKKGRETLLTLLEAFVYDPLVDWAIGEDGLSAIGITAKSSSIIAADDNLKNNDLSSIDTKNDLKKARKHCEREMMRETLTMRLVEIKSEWNQNRHEMQQQLMLISTLFNDLIKQREQMLNSETKRNLLSKQISLIREVQALGSAMASHPLNTLSQRYAIYKKNKDEISLIRNKFIKKAEEFETIVNNYVEFVGEMKQNMISEYMSDLKELCERNFPLSEFDLVKDLLEQSAQTQIYVQSDLLRNKLDDANKQRGILVERTFELLMQYYNVSQYYPDDHVSNHRLSKFSMWCRSLSKNKSNTLSRGILLEYQQLFGEQAIKNSPQNVLSFGFQLNGFLSTSNHKLKQLYNSLQCNLSNIKSSYGYDNMKQKLIVDFQYSPNDALIVNELCTLLHSLLNDRLRVMTCDNLFEMSMMNEDSWHFDEWMSDLKFIGDIYAIIDKKMVAEKGTIYVEKYLNEVEKVHNYLYHLENQFRVFVLPHTLQAILTENKSVLDMITHMMNIQKGFKPLNEIYRDLETDFINENPTSEANLICVEMKNRLAAMIAEYNLQATESMGKKIFLSIMTLFDAMNGAVENMNEEFDASLVPDSLMTMDEIKRIKKLFFINEKQKSCLQHMLFIRRFGVVIELFSVCLQFAWLFKGSGEPAIENFDQMTEPFKKYSSDLAIHFLLGRMLVPLAVNIISLSKEVTICDNSRMNQLLMLHNEFSTDQTMKKCHKLLAEETENNEMIKNILSCHNWLNEDIYAGQVVAPIVKERLLDELKNSMRALADGKVLVTKMSEEIKQLTIIVMQKLKWAAGANPLLNDLLNNFEDISKKKQNFLEQQNKYADVALKHCGTVLKFEILRTKSQESFASDQEFLSYLAKWETLCLQDVALSNTVNPIEEAIVELLDPEGLITSEWIENVTTLIDDMIDLVDKEIDMHEKKFIQFQDNLQICAHKLRNLMNNHHRMASDIKNRLKTSLKCYEENKETISNYLVCYKKFFDIVTELHGNILSKDFTESVVCETNQQISEALDMMDEVFQGLFAIEVNLRDVTDNLSKKQLSKKTSSELADTGDGIKRVQNQKEQKRNAYAVSVWRRIRMKLEGRDPDPNKCYRTAEQIDWMIREAMNPDNLATLYEGWTAWV